MTPQSGAEQLAGWWRYPIRRAAPLARLVLKLRAAYRNGPGRYDNPWGATRTGMGEPLFVSDCMLVS